MYVTGSLVTPYNNNNMQPVLFLGETPFFADSLVGTYGKK